MNVIRNGTKIIATTAVALQATVFCAADTDKSGHRKIPENISVYLKPESQDIIGSFFKKRGKVNDAKLVCIGSQLSEKDTFVYQPLFGERTAFRLKGIIETKEGDIVGIGRVSTMVGELKVDSYEASLPIQAPNSSNSLQVLLDLPTRLSSDAKSKNYWQGRVPPGKVGDRKYSALSANYIALPYEKQIVLEGYLCSDKFVDEKGNCLFDRASLETADLVLSSAVDGSSSANESGLNKTNTKVEETECPLCKYIKSGPCKEHFLAWEACVNEKTDEEIAQCFSLTGEMMRCFKDHEYYDMMTAGTDYSKFEAAAAGNKTNQNVVAEAK
jgi:hypothetical protein